VWAVRLSGGQLHVLILDKGSRSATVELRVPGAGVATVQRLLAPSIHSPSGVTLAGQHVGTDARWQGPRVVETVRTGSHGYVITVPRMSAALVGLQRAPVPSRASENETGAASRRPVS
jgi:glycosyl hydrolase family 79